MAEVLINLSTKAVLNSTATAENTDTEMMEGEQLTDNEKSLIVTRDSQVRWITYRMVMSYEDIWFCRYEDTY